MMEFQKKNPKGQKKKKNPSTQVYALYSFYFYFLKQAVIHPYLLLKKQKGCLPLYRINLATTMVARTSRGGFFGLKNYFHLKNTL